MNVHLKVMQATLGCLSELVPLVLFLSFHLSISFISSEYFLIEQ